MIFRNSIISENLAELGYSKLHKLPLKMSILEHLLSICSCSSKNRGFHCSATIQKTQGAVSKYYRLDPRDRITNSMPLSKELDPNECKKFNRSPNAMDSPELNQYAFKQSFTYFDRLCFQVAIEEGQFPATVTKVITVHTAAFTHQPDKYNWNTDPSITKPKCPDKQENLTDKDCWSIVFEELSLDCDDMQNELILEGHTYPCLQSDHFC